jgi:hypothetical protein
MRAAKRRDRSRDEPWGVRRFFVRAPDGNIINIVSHSDE